MSSCFILGARAADDANYLFCRPNFFSFAPVIMSTVGILKILYILQHTHYSFIPIENLWYLFLIYKTAVLYICKMCPFIMLIIFYWSVNIFCLLHLAWLWCGVSYPINFSFQNYIIKYLIFTQCMRYIHNTVSYVNLKID